MASGCWGIPVSLMMEKSIWHGAQMGPLYGGMSLAEEYERGRDIITQTVWGAE